MEKHTLKHNIRQRVKKTKMDLGIDILIFGRFYKFKRI